MVKNCPVILNNDAVTVIEFDGVKVQLPSINKDAEKVCVSFENGRYEIVSESKNITSEITEEKESRKENSKYSSNHGSKKKSTANKEEN